MNNVGVGVCGWVLRVLRTREGGRGMERSSSGGEQLQGMIEKDAV